MSSNAYLSLLPSVGAGNLLQDLLQSDVVPTVRLQHIFRQAEQSLIVRNAHRIVNGEIPTLTQKDSDFFFLPRRSPQKVSETILTLVGERLPEAYGYSAMDEIQVLCPQRKGDAGTIQLNQSLQQQLNPDRPEIPYFRGPQYTFRQGDKVMQTKNNYDMEWDKQGVSGQGIFNGDIGSIQMIDRGSQTACIHFDGRICYYSFEMIVEQLELAYAITVHKSQGSEFEAVVMPVLGGYDKLYYRNLLYTAVTRAKKLLILVGQEERIAFMVNNHIKSVRFTNLRYLLDQMIHGSEYL